MIGKLESKISSNHGVVGSSPTGRTTHDDKLSKLVISAGTRSSWEIKSFALTLTGVALTVRPTSLI